MVSRPYFFLPVVLFLAVFTTSFRVLAEEHPVSVPDKLLCAEMIRFGKEAYQRGRFQDAKEFFRRATIADPQSKKAWRFYDQSVVFALAEKVEAKENRDLLLPGTSMGDREQPPASHSGSQTSTVKSPPLEQLPQIVTPVEENMADEWEEEEEEGC